MKVDLKKIKTESQNELTKDIDLLDTLSIVSLINEEDKKSILFSLNAIVSTFPCNTQVYHYSNDNVIGVVDEGIVQIIRNDYNGDRVLIEELKKNQIFGSHMSSITSLDFEVIFIY